MCSKMKKRPLNRGFSLIEIGIALMIIGVLVGAVFKGQELLENAKTHSILSDFRNIKQAIHAYNETYGALPGDDPGATRFGIAAGNGDGQISTPSLVWQHLNKAGLWNSDKAPASKLGGVYTVKSDISNWIVLAKDEQGTGLLTPKQAAAIKAKLQQGDNEIVEVENGHNAATPCTNGGQINYATTQSVCTLKLKLS